MGQRHEHRTSRDAAFADVSRLLIARFRALRQFMLKNWADHGARRFLCAHSSRRGRIETGEYFCACVVSTEAALANRTGLHPYLDQLEFHEITGELNKTYRINYHVLETLNSRRAVSWRMIHKRERGSGRNPSFHGFAHYPLLFQARGEDGNDYRSGPNAKP
jgi:hypothetical protein